MGPAVTSPYAPGAVPDGAALGPTVVAGAADVIGGMVVGGEADPGGVLVIAAGSLVGLSVVGVMVADVASTTIVLVGVPT